MTLYLIRTEDSRYRLGRLKRTGEPVEQIGALAWDGLVSIRVFSPHIVMVGRRPLCMDISCQRVIRVPPDAVEWHGPCEPAGINGADA